MISGLIGSSGFVGGNLSQKISFNFYYNSKNISDARGINFDLIICAAPSAVKWKANKYPEEDFQIIEKLKRDIQYIKTKKFVLISTVDVFKTPIHVNEDTIPDIEDLHPYGKHRVYLEDFTQKTFFDSSIIRLPALFGDGLKKNFIFDLMHNNCLELTHKDSSFQYFYLNKLWGIIKFVIENNISILNVSSEPIKSDELAFRCFQKDFKNITESPPITYDMKSKYDSLLGGSNGYLFSKDTIFTDLREYLKKQKLPL